MNRRAFFASMIPGFLTARGRLSKALHCPVCGRRAIWAEAREADVTTLADRCRRYIVLGLIYWHEDGSRCHRDLRSVVQA